MSQVPDNIKYWSSLSRPEDPAKLAYFRLEVASLSWSDEHVEQSLRRLFDATDDLVMAEIAYYYSKRGSRRWMANVFKFLAWAIGTVGTLTPLVASAHTEWKDHASWGYVAIAIAGSLAVLNSIFGWTDGHSRFASTQISLEGIKTKRRIEWSFFLRKLAVDSIDPSTIEGGFNIISNYGEEVYKAIGAETSAWQKLSQENLAGALSGWSNKS